MAYTSYTGGIPNRQDPTNFSDYMDAWIAWYTPNATDLVSQIASVTFADTTNRATAWVSGASYTAGDAVYSTTDWQTYRAKTTHSGETTDPSADGTNWASPIGLSDYMPFSGGTFTGAVKVLELQETLASALSGTTPSIDLETGTYFTLTTSGNTTFTFTNPAASGTVSQFTLEITAGGTHTLTWPASVDWAGGSAPGAPASGETDIYTFVTRDGGTTWFGFLAGDAMA